MRYIWLAVILLVVVICGVVVKKILRKRDCSRGKHNFSFNDSVWQYFKEGSCSAIIEGKCTYCGIKSSRVEDRHVWDGLVCSRCQETRTSKICNECDENGQIIVSHCDGCGNAISTGCGCTNDHHMETCGECHGRKIIYSKE